MNFGLFGAATSSLKDLVLKFVLLVATIGQLGQCVAGPQFSLQGQQYEAVDWPDSGGAIISLSGSWTGGSGGTVTTSSNWVEGNAPTTMDFINSEFQSVGFDISGLPFFRSNAGQGNGSNANTLNYNFTAGDLPRDVLYYVGDGINGMKYGSWEWFSSSPTTVFTLINQSASVQDITGDGTGALTWRTYGSFNNTASVLVRVSDPNGVANFSIRSNRLDAAGVDITYASPGPKSDFSNTGVLINISPASSANHATSVPTFTPVHVLLLALALSVAVRRYAKLRVIQQSKR
ncbi:hypothetical protein [uncultured Pseudoteredinibacter sp.]|uniref:hypothetical protein n=1 Tax=uncultured Pseudoteredinibacter sp. TaxID=1641701 RepID=UPI00260D1302|nr:hypothetical protein [uncultured Pseudoteredinibacter sp.]